VDKKGIRWLYGELPRLVEERILTLEDARRLREHYGEPQRRSGPSPGLVICAVLGSALIALGIILLFAHNWPEFSRPVRTALSFAPLVLAQILTGWVILRRPNSRAWCEGSAVFHMGAVGASIALVGQTYHISGDPESFLLAWMLLSVPLVYIPGASTPAALYWIGITSWSGMLHGRNDLWFWPLASIPLWHLIQVVRAGVRRPRSVFLLWVLALCLCIATGSTLGRVVRHDWVLAYGGLFSLLYLMDARWPKEGCSLWRRPFCLIGSAGILVLSLILTFDYRWGAGPYASMGEGWINALSTLLGYGILLSLVILPIILLLSGFRSARRDRLMYGSFCLLTLSGYILSRAGAATAVMLLFNLYLALLGIVTLRAGLRSGALLKVNGGLLILSALITARFFDSDIPFTVRGVLFILIGAGFLAANILTRRRRGGA